MILCRGAPRHSGLAAPPGHRGTRLVGPGRQIDAHPRAGGGSPTEEVAQLAASLPATSWVRRTIKEGSKESLIARFVRVRVASPYDPHDPGPFLSGADAAQMKKKRRA